MHIVFCRRMAQIDNLNDRAELPVLRKIPFYKLCPAPFLGLGNLCVAVARQIHQTEITGMKKLMVPVFPGVALTRASALRFTSLLIKDDFLHSTCRKNNFRHSGRRQLFCGACRGFKLGGIEIHLSPLRSVRLLRNPIHYRTECFSLRQDWFFFFFV